MPNKQNRGDYGNPPNTTVPSPPVKGLKRGQRVPTPTPAPTPHPFKQNKL